jgi:hypothetical protein
MDHSLCTQFNFLFAKNADLEIGFQHLVVVAGDGGFEFGHMSGSDFKVLLWLM